MGDQWRPVDPRWVAALSAYRSGTACPFLDAVFDEVMAICYVEADGTPAKRSALGKAVIGHRKLRRRVRFWLVDATQEPATVLTFVDDPRGGRLRTVSGKYTPRVSVGQPLGKRRFSVVTKRRRAESNPSKVRDLRKRKPTPADARGLAGVFNFLVRKAALNRLGPQRVEIAEQRARLWAVMKDQ